MSRAQILGDIRRALESRNAGRVSRERAINERLASPPQHCRPTTVGGSAAELVRRFVARLKDQSAQVVEVDSVAELPRAVAGLLANAGLGLEMRMGADPRFAVLAWQSAGIARLDGPAQAGDAAGLSHAIAGVAETGTLVLASGRDNPTSLAFVPDVHVVAVGRATIVGSYEEAFKLVRADVEGSTMPRAVNLVSGASRTGDIGGRIVMGAHGPRTLCVIVYGEAVAS